MSYYERYGELSKSTLNFVTGKTASEQIQSRTDLRTDEIRRAGRKITVMSDEEWNRREEAMNKRAAEYKAKLDKEQAEHRLSREKALQPIRDRIEREKKYPSLIHEKLSLFHEPADESPAALDAWDIVYKETSPFLAKVVIAYRYGLDKGSGRLDNTAIGYYGGDDLVSCLRARDIGVSGNETAFDRLVSMKFLAAALVDNIETISKDESQAARKELLEFIIGDEVTEIEITELVIET
ncbi:hypothetical protein N7466_004055 [Penicillium verhagenii]|uniref:uncharacterized protein n=1 Tax=Penicillium verhagenii TaxID=1562060 RepID=UPI0025450C5E|nr:uncharacterized protein N7466_004055 [Penicillium verhagenii]KAJ5934508.1 hypothetical protein N7466_004055 [Penicillium verhagenii]